MNPCWFPGKKNPETGSTCSGKETFANIKDTSKMPDDTLIKLYYGALGLLGLYILMKLVTKKN